MQYCEIFKDIVVDLLHPENLKDLQPKETEEGYLVPNLSSAQLLDYDDFEKYFLTGISRRTTSVSDFGAYSERASCFIFFNITSHFIDPKIEN